MPLWVLLLQSIALIALIVVGSMPLVFIALGLYFISFNLQEALFPAQVSKLADAGKRWCRWTGIFRAYKSFRYATLLL